MTPSTPEQLLTATSEAFLTSDVEALSGLFSARPDATYAGSEAGERATGPAALRELFTAVLGREETYAFSFGAPLCLPVGEGMALLADGQGVETTAAGAQTTFDYRISGVAVREADRWVWLLLHGAEPTAALPDT